MAQNAASGPPMNGHPNDKLPADDGSESRMLPEADVAMSDQKHQAPQLQESTSFKIHKALSNATKMAFFYTVPETARNNLHFPIAVGMGAGIVVGLILCLVGLFVYYGQCETVRVLTTDPNASEGCTEQLLPQSFTDVLDLYGKWKSGIRFQAAYGLWQVEYKQFLGNEAQTKHALRLLQEKMHVFLQGLNGMLFFESIQMLLYSNITQESPTGSGLIRMSPNVDLVALVGDKLVDYAIARNLTTYLGRNLTSNDRKQLLQGSELAGCKDDAYVHGDNYLQFKGLLGASIFSADQFGTTDADGDADTRLSVKHFAANGTGPYRKCALQIQNVSSMDQMPILSQLWAYPGRGEYYNLEWDLNQVFAVDHCNKHRDHCMDVLGAGNASQIATQKLFTQFDVTERFPTMYSPTLDAFGYIWNTWYSIHKKAYFVVPELWTMDDCLDCSTAKTAEYDCQAQMAVILSFFEVPMAVKVAVFKGTTGEDPDDDDEANPALAGSASDHILDVPHPYYYSFQYTLQLSGAMNQDLAQAHTQCNVSDLFFKVEGDAFEQTVIVPFPSSTGVKDCRVQSCKTPLERLGLSFSNISLFYTVLSVLVIGYVIVMNNRQNAKRASAEKAAAHKKAEYV